MKNVTTMMVLFVAACVHGSTPAVETDPGDVSSPIVDTQQANCFDVSGNVIDCPISEDQDFFGQDAYYVSRSADYSDNADGTVSDHNTGLMWQQDPLLATFDEASAACAESTSGGYSDWRVPTIDELYSLMDFNGCTGSAGPDSTEVPDNAIPYLDTDYFTFYYGNELSGAGSRFIDAQYISSTEYVASVFGGESAFFGVNFADGRIKGYPTAGHRGWFLRCVRGDGYGENEFVDNDDDTVTDVATGLTWMQRDSGHLGAGELGDGTLDWAEALSWCANLDHAGSSDWRLPNVKELQSLVDYSRSPDTTDSAAIDPVFQTSAIVNEAGDRDFPYFWSGTTHLDGRVLGTDAAYVAFGRALGYMDGWYMDVHGAGAQRGDPKVGSRESAGCGMGPQGDCRRIYNFARCVRN